jgi:Zn-dependent oligopeptidase
MISTLDRKFAKVWQLLKKNAEVSSSAWFKRADTSISSKVEAYQSALSKAQSGLVEDLLKLGKTLRDLETAIVKFADSKGVAQVRAEDGTKSAKPSMVAEVSRFKNEVQHERSLFDSRLKAALAAADNDLKKLESIEQSKKKELWKGFGVDL